MLDPREFLSPVNAGESAPKEPSSSAKIEANRRNAMRSTGPKTPSGKKRSSRNARKHGLLTKEVVITTGPGKENEDEFLALLAGIRNTRAPVGISEDLFVQEIAVSYWRSSRALRSERGAITLGSKIPHENPELTELDHTVLRTMSDADARFELLKSSRGLNYLLRRLEDIMKKEVRTNGHISPESRWLFPPAKAWGCGSTKKVILSGLESKIEELTDRKAEIEKDELYESNARGDFASIPPKVDLDSIHVSVEFSLLYTTRSSLDSLEIVFSGSGRTKRFSPRRGVTLRRGGTLLQSMFTCARVPAIARFHTLLKSRRDRLLVLAALRARFLGRGGSINRR